MPPSKKAGSNKPEMGPANKTFPKKSLNLNIYSTKNVEMTHDDENYERRVQMKDLIFYMQRDPQLKNSQILYQTLVKF